MKSYELSEKTEMLLEAAKHLVENNLAVRISPYDNEFEQYETLTDRESDLSFCGNLVRETNGPILDVACGSGQLTLALLNRGYDVGGIDNLESMIERAKSEIALVEYNSVMEVQDMRNFRLEKE